MDSPQTKYAHANLCRVYHLWMTCCFGHFFRLSFFFLLLLLLSAGQKISHETRERDRKKENIIAVFMEDSCNVASTLCFYVKRLSKINGPAADSVTVKLIDYCADDERVEL